jgi:hypothetical protein
MNAKGTRHYGAPFSRRPTGHAFNYYHHIKQSALTPGLTPESPHATGASRNTGLDFLVGISAREEK